MKQYKYIATLIAILLTGIFCPVISAEAKATLTFEDETQISKHIQSEIFYIGQSLRTIGNPWIYDASWKAVHLEDGIYSPTPDSPSPKNNYFSPYETSLNIDTDYNWNIVSHIKEKQHLYPYQMKEGDIMPVSSWEYVGQVNAVHHASNLNTYCSNITGNWYNYCGVTCLNASGPGCTVHNAKYYSTLNYLLNPTTNLYEIANVSCTENFMRSKTQFSTTIINYPTWRSRCAICGQYLDNVMFECPKKSLKDIKYIEIGTHIITKCRACGAIENDGYTTHTCQAISDNRYFIYYNKGSYDPDITGTSKDTIFYTEGAIKYEGVYISSPKNILTDCPFIRPGYSFIGWSLTDDNIPEYQAGDIIFDCDFYDTQCINNNDIVNLYACWSAEAATIQIDTETNNIWGNSVGSIFGASNYVETKPIHQYRTIGSDNEAYDNATTQDFTNNTLLFTNSNMITPKGFHVQYHAEETIADSYQQICVTGYTKMQVSGETEAFLQAENTQGIYDDNGCLTSLLYTFTKAPCVEKIILNYKALPIVLPSSNKDGSLFVGWYTTPDFQEGTFVGTSGDNYTPDSNKTLYARYSEANLEISDVYYSTESPLTYDNVAMENNIANNHYSIPNNILAVNYAKGALNLRSYLYVPAGKQITYKTYYKLSSSSTWNLFNGTSGAEGTSSVDYDANYLVNGSTDVHFSSENEQTYTVPSTGYYELTAFGAQGQDYSTTLVGGLGGEVNGQVYLQKDEVLTVYVGNHGSHGSGYYLEGGGYTYIYKTDLFGNRILLMVAGGGGAAGQGAKGGDGGNTNNSTLLANETNIVQLGESHEEKAYPAGGCGYHGGTAGSIHKHTHNGTLTANGATVSGGCYTTKVTKTTTCGGSTYCYRSDDGGMYYGNICSDGNGGWTNCMCPRCGSWDCPGHTITYDYYKCSKCGRDYGQSNPGRCSASSTTTYYTLSCGRIEAANPSYGGSNYINPIVRNPISNSGKRTGNGLITIHAIMVGLQDGTDNNAEILGVKTPDLNVPDAVILKKDDTSGSSIITWNEPKSNGTNYDIKFEEYEVTNDVSYNDGLKPIMSTDAVTKKVTSAIAGYYYLYTDDTSFNIANYLKNILHYTDIYTWADKHYSDDVIQFTQNTSLPLNDRTHTYLYVAAVDVAGNIGPTRSLETLKTNVGTVQFNSNPFYYQLNKESSPWYANHYTFEDYYAIDGSSVLNNNKGYDGTATNLTFNNEFPTITMNNCTFIGWNTSKDGSGLWINQNGSGDGLTSENPRELCFEDITGKTLPGQTIILYAIWKENVSNTVIVTGTQNQVTITNNGVQIAPTTVTVSDEYQWVSNANLDIHTINATGAYEITTALYDYIVNAIRGQLHYYTAGDTPTSTTNELITQTKLNSAMNGLEDDTKYHTTFQLTEDCFLQGAYKIYNTVTTRESNKKENNTQKVFVDSTPVQIKEYEIVQDSLATLTEEEVRTKYLAGTLTLNTIFKVHATDFANATYGNYIDPKDTSGVKGVYITFYTDTTSVTKQMILTSELSKTTSGLATLDGWYEYSIDLAHEFPDDSYVSFRVEAIDNAGNMSTPTFVTDMSNPTFDGGQFTGILKAFDIVSYIYNTVSDEYTMADGVTTYFIAGDIAKVVTYTVGYAEKVEFNFDELGLLCEDYITKNKYSASDYMGIPTAPLERQRLYSYTDGIRIDSPNPDIDSVSYARKYEFFVRIFPYITFHSGETVLEKFYTATGSKTQSGYEMDTSFNRKYYIFKSEDDELHYRSY